VLSGAKKLAEPTGLAYWGTAARGGNIVSKCIGIDFGTSKAAAAVWESGRPVPIRRQGGARTLPSSVSIDEHGNFQVGEASLAAASTDPTRFSTELRRRLGAYSGITRNGVQLSTQEVAAQLLAQLKRDAESQLGESVTQAVIAVPGTFGQWERVAMVEACALAELDVISFIGDSVASALAHGMGR